jgi:hypothetical protein
MHCLNLFNVSSTFEMGRKVGVAYDSSKFAKINYANLPIGDKVIFQGALEMDTIAATTLGTTGNGENQFPAHTPTMSFQTASYSNDYFIAGAGTGTSPIYDVGAVYEASQGANTFAPYLTPAYLLAGGDHFFLGGSKIHFTNYLYDYPADIVAGTPKNDFMAVNYGPGLALLNSFNCAISESITGSPVPFQSNASSPTPTAMTMGIPSTLFTSGSKEFIQQKKSEDRNYFIQNYSASNVGGFKEEEGGTPFMIKVGDEILVTYDNQKNKGSNISGTNFVQQSFVVTEISGVIDQYQTPNFADYSASYCDSTQCLAPNAFFGFSNANGFLKNKITVTPPPSTTDIQGIGPTSADYGEINSFVIRRRTEADDRVIVYQTPPTTFGVNENTGSGGGYLIPDDFSPIQKRNALTLINQLKAKNAFRDDSQLPNYKGE